MVRKRYYMGIMSGTSCDALDIVCLQIVGAEELSCQLLFHESYAYPNDIKADLLSYGVAKSIEIENLSQLEVKLMHLYADKVNDALTKHTIKPQKITAIGLHGQTIRHNPNATYPYSLQLGDPSVLATNTSINVISHFRQSDIANGGQGAPLAAIFHQQLLRQNKGNSPTQHKPSSEVVINLGGIANVSCVYKDDGDKLLAFDVGPANTLIDAWVREKQLHPKGFDEGGCLAYQGNINSALFSLLLDEPYFSKPAPKSTGRELFNMAWLDHKLTQYRQTLSDQNALANNTDILTTLVELSAYTIAHSLPEDLGVKWEYVWLSGGGIKNVFLMEAIRKQLVVKYPTIHVGLFEQRVGMPSQCIEAAAWAWLAYLYDQKVALDLSTITGAKVPSVLGRKSLA